MKESFTDDKSMQKGEQLIQNIYSKFANILIGARCPLTGRKMNKWFNLEEMDALKEELKAWRDSPGNMPPLIIQIYLDTSKLDHSQSLLLRNPSTGKFEIIGNDQLADFDNDVPIRKKSILLESWQLTLSSLQSRNNSPNLPLIYKRYIAFFRRLYSFIRWMPAYRLKRQIDKGNIGFKSHELCFRISSFRQNIPNEAGLGGIYGLNMVDQLHVSGDLTNGIVENSFGAMETPFGLANLHVAFRRDCDFRIIESELNLEDNFVDLQELFSVNQVPRNIPLSMQRNNFIQRKSSVASFSTDSEPPKSLTSPRTGSIKTFDINGSVDSQSLRLRGNVQNRISITPGSLPSPSILAFTPPSVTSSFRNNSGKLISARETPPFSSETAFQPAIKNNLVESPPFAFNEMMSVLNNRAFVEENSARSTALISRSTLSRSVIIKANPELYSISAPKQYAFSPKDSLELSAKVSDLKPAFTFRHAFESKENPLPDSEAQDSINDGTPYIQKARAAIQRFKALKETNLVFVTSMLASSSTRSLTGETDDDLLFAMSELDH